MTEDGRTLIGKKRLEGHETESLVMGSGKKEKGEVHVVDFAKTKIDLMAAGVQPHHSL
jgi:hypothetical protein